MRRPKNCYQISLRTVQPAGARATQPGRYTSASMPEFHGEPYVYLAGLTHDSALIAWGAFYFRIKENRGTFKLLDAQDVEPALRETIGRKSTPYGPARIVVRDLAGVEVATARV